MDNEKFNTYSSLIFVELAFTSKKFVKELADNFKELHGVIAQLIETPSSENQYHLQNLFAHNEESLKKYLHEYLLANESELNWTTFLNKYEVIPVAGRLFKIEKTEKAYAEFVQRMKNERWVFSFMNVTSDEASYTILFA